jgi:hypothetical protein
MISNGAVVLPVSTQDHIHTYVIKKVISDFTMGHFDEHFNDHFDDHLCYRLMLFY